MKNQFDNKQRSTAGYNYEKYNTFEKVGWSWFTVAVMNRSFPLILGELKDSLLYIFQIEAWTASITAENPNLVTRSQIGSSFEGRPMYLLKVFQP